jgi:hypothetical protein
MSIVKIIEVISEGKTIDEALQSAVAEASKTIQEINQIDISHIRAIVENNTISKIRITAKLSFLVKHHDK